jgi:hypothetical protein
MEVTLADVLTLTGAAISAGLITGLLEVLKRVLPIIAARGWEQALALLFSLVLVGLAFYDAGTYTLDAAFAAFIAWLAIAKLATGIFDEVTRRPGAFTSPS